MEKKTAEQILIDKVGKLSISGLKWKSLADRKKLIIAAMHDFADQQNQELREENEKLKVEAELDDKIIQNLKAEVKRLREGLESLRADAWIFGVTSTEVHEKCKQLLKTNGDE